MKPKTFHNRSSSKPQITLKMNMNVNKLTVACALLAAASLPALATNYTGNGNTGFGGAIGNGSLTLTDDGANLTISLSPSGGSLGGGNDLVLYMDTVAGGFSDTSGFKDDGDGGRSAVSGYSSSGQSVLTFASGFAPSYAVDIQGAYASLFSLANGGANSLTYKTGASQTGSPFTLTIPFADIGLTPNDSQSQTFKLFGTLVSETGYRSTEAIAGDDTGTAQGWSPFTQTSYATYTVIAVPEPSTLAIAGLSGLAALLVIRRRRA